MSSWMGSFGRRTLFLSMRKPRKPTWGSQLKEPTRRTLNMCLFRPKRSTLPSSPRFVQDMLATGQRGAERAERRMGRPKAHVALAGGPRSRGAVAVGYATSPSALRQRTVLFQYGGPRLG